MNKHEKNNFQYHDSSQTKIRHQMCSKNIKIIKIFTISNFSILKKTILSLSRFHCLFRNASKQCHRYFSKGIKFTILSRCISTRISLWTKQIFLFFLSFFFHPRAQIYQMKKNVRQKKSRMILLVIKTHLLSISLFSKERKQSLLFFSFFFQFFNKAIEHVSLDNEWDWSRHVTEFVQNKCFANNRSEQC